jgi:hypothetical protein
MLLKYLKLKKNIYNYFILLSLSIIYHSLETYTDPSERILISEYFEVFNLILHHAQQADLLSTD